MYALLLELTNKNLLLGFMPESLGLLLFGIGLIAFAVSLRRVFNRKEMMEGDYKRLPEKVNQ
jgi:hypothetical protein